MKTNPLDGAERILYIPACISAESAATKPAPPQAGDGKPHHYWALVESHRTARGPRQRVVAYLGEMDEVPLTGLGVQQAAQNHPGHQMALRDDATPEWVEVNVRAVRTERARRFGDVWLALELLKKLRLDHFFQQALASSRPKVSWAALATILVVARFCEPKSELHIAEHFYSPVSGTRHPRL